MSLDSVASHKAFADDNQLPFRLLADDGHLADLYGVDHAKGYAKRTTFVIGKDGAIASIFRDVKVEGHEAEVLEAVRAAAAK